MVRENLVKLIFVLSLFIINGFAHAQPAPSNASQPTVAEIDAKAKALTDEMLQAAERKQGKVTQEQIEAQKKLIEKSQKFYFEYGSSMSTDKDFTSAQSDLLIVTDALDKALKKANAFQCLPTVFPTVRHGDGHGGINPGKSRTFFYTATADGSQDTYSFEIKSTEEFPYWFSIEVKGKTIALQATKNSNGDISVKDDLDQPPGSQIPSIQAAKMPPDKADLARKSALGDMVVDLIETHKARHYDYETTRTEYLNSVCRQLPYQEKYRCKSGESTKCSPAQLRHNEKVDRCREAKARYADLIKVNSKLRSEIGAVSAQCKNQMDAKTAQTITDYMNSAIMKRDLNDKTPGAAPVNI